MKYVIQWQTGWAMDIAGEIQDHILTFESDKDKETLVTEIGCKLIDFENFRTDLFKKMSPTKDRRDLETQLKKAAQIQVDSLNLNALDMEPVNADTRRTIEYDFTIQTLDEWFTQNQS